MNDTATAVAALEAEPFVELDPELHEVAYARRSLVGENLHRARPAETTSCAERVLGMERRIVVLPHRRRDPALGEETRRREEWPFREDEHVALGRCAQRGEEPRHASADDDERDFAIGRCLSVIGHGSFSL